MNKFKKQFTSFISCVLTVVILMSTSSTLIYATENVVSQSSEQSEAVNNDINKTEKNSSIDVIENNIKQDESKSDSVSLSNKTKEANEVNDNTESDKTEQVNAKDDTQSLNSSKSILKGKSLNAQPNNQNSTQEDFKIALKWGRSIR